MTADVWARYPAAIRGEYGDSPELCAHLVRLICAGVKTATCGALRDYHADQEPIPKAGDIEIVLHWDEKPAAVVRVTDVTVRAFNTVPESFALAEGEDTSLAQWAASHRAYFERNGGWSPELRLVCQTFDLIEVL